MKKIISLICVLSSIFAFVGCSRDEKMTFNGVEVSVAKSIPVLMYHHFADETEGGAVVAKEEFIKQINYLKENNYNTITVQDLIDFKNGDIELPEKSILITSDDGYLSNYDFMYPILKENNMKATINIIGDKIDNAQKNIEAGSEIPKFNWEQAKEMYDSGLIDFQSHTYDSHYKITNENKEKGVFSMQQEGESIEEYVARIDKDLKESIKGFEENLGYKPIAFAYPFGEYSEEAEQVLKDNGILVSFTVKSGVVPRKGDDTYLLNRVTVSGEDDLDTFIKKLNNK
jgi:peptidoglycan/xylan/chitin deacetylase (PgdA/CDA1 family)